MSEENLDSLLNYPSILQTQQFGSQNYPHHALIRPGLTQNLRGVAGLLFNHLTVPILDTGVESYLLPSYCMFNRFLTYNSQLEDLTRKMQLYACY